jgi:hypothetical protein
VGVLHAEGLEDVLDCEAGIGDARELLDGVCESGVGDVVVEPDVTELCSLTVEAPFLGLMRELY